MANPGKGPSVLLVAILCLCALGSSNCQYLTEESKRLDKFAQNLSMTLNPDANVCDEFGRYVDEALDVRKLNEFGYNEIKSAYDSFIADGWVLSRADSKAKDFYESCTEHRPETYVDAITELNIARSVLEFKTLNRFGPTVHGDNNLPFSWSKVVGVLQGYDVTAFVSGNATENGHGTMKFHLAPGKFDLTQTEFWNGDLKSVLQYYGLGEDEILDLIRSLEELERKFSGREAAGTETNMTISDLQNKFPNFEWKHYFQILANTEHITEAAQVTVTDLGKIEEYYNAHNFPELTETAVAYYFLKLHAKLNQEYYAVKNDKSLCYIKTFNLFKEVFANIVLQNMDEHDEVNYNDTVRSILHAVLELANQDTRKEIEAELEKTMNAPNVAVDKENYKEYVGYSFPFFTDNRYLSNYLRAYNFVRIRRIAGRHQTYLDNIGLYYNLYSKPRLFWLTTLGYTIASGVLQQYDIWLHNHTSAKCRYDYGDAAPYKALLDAADYLAEQDPEKFQNEVKVLSKYDLDPKKIVHIMCAKIFSLPGRGFYTPADSLMLFFNEFRASFNCRPPLMLGVMDSLIKRKCGFPRVEI